MYKYIVLCLCVSLSGVLCELNKNKGADCEWDGGKGTCVKETRCLSTLDVRGEKHLVCSKQGNVTIVCCTDCELVNSTRNVVIPPTSGYHFKDGTKARDSCLEYLDTLSYSCREMGYYAGIGKYLDEARKCHIIGVWGIGNNPGPGPIYSYETPPHLARLGYGEDLASAEWNAGGSIISRKYILTAAYVPNNRGSNDGPKFVAVGDIICSVPPSAWQTYEVKRFIPHPSYKFPENEQKNSIKCNDIALIETTNPIQFNRYVQPACLHVQAADTTTPITNTWKDPKSNFTKLADKIVRIHVYEFSQEDCNNAYGMTSSQGIDYETQMCYGTSPSYSDPEVFQGLPGEPLMINNQFSKCIYTIIGVTSESFTHFRSNITPSIYTRVAHYKPWIESIVWA